MKQANESEKKLLDVLRTALAEERDRLRRQLNDHLANEGVSIETVQAERDEMRVERDALAEERDEYKARYSETWQRVRELMAEESELDEFEKGLRDAIERRIPPNDPILVTFRNLRAERDAMRDALEALRQAVESGSIKDRATRDRLLAWALALSQGEAVKRQ